MRKFIIFFLVVAAHIVGTYLVKWYNSSNKTTTPKKVVEQPIKRDVPPTDEPTLIKDDVPVDSISNSNTEQQHTVKEKTVKKTTHKLEIKPFKHDNPNFGKPFLYDRAVMGNIPELPGSKQATTGILVDLGTRKVLWAKHPRKGVPIASMTKIMTTLLALELIQSNPNISLDTVIPVTKEAMKTGGSSVYLDVREKFPLRELLKTIMIKSANDSAQLVAQFFGGGTRDKFIALMNKKARQLYLPSTRFYTPHGLPDNKRRNNISSPEGMAILAEQLLEYPLAMKWASTWQATFRSPKSKAFQKFRNHNNLVMTRPKLGCRGVDGLKTGFIRKSGFCITVTCKRDKRRLVGVVTGFRRAKDRDKFVRKLLDWGYKKEAERYKKEHDWIK